MRYLRRLVLRLIGPLVQHLAKWYFSKPRAYRYKNIKGVVNPGVFYPHWTLSTKLLMQFLEDKDLNQKLFLELGCGTGMISVFAAKKGANVMATDINPKALENAKQNAEMNEVEVECIPSDLFENLKGRTFDFIIINPPYYPKKAETVEEAAWFCGEDFAYFQKLFLQLGDYVQAQVFMILSEDCQIDQIKSMAAEKGFAMQVLQEKRKWGEMNFVFGVETYTGV